MRGSPQSNILSNVKLCTNYFPPQLMHGYTCIHASIIPVCVHVHAGTDT